MKLNHEMLTMVRSSKGWTQRQLAEAVSVSQAFLSRVEAGNQTATDDLIMRLATELESPVALLAAESPVQGLAVSCLHHRRRSSTMTAGTKRRIEALTHLSRMTVDGLLHEIDLDPELDLPVDRWIGAVPGNAAADLRLHWHLPRGPIRDLTSLVEASGVVIVRRPLEAAGQDAVSSWPIDGRAIIVVRSGLSADRLRFTLAHELGHLLLHRTPGDDQEPAANEFASALLAPAEDIGPDLAGLTTGDLARLLELKPKWGMSVAALVRRAHDLGVISERQYREFQIRLNRLGWRTVEPGTLRAEQPRTLDLVIKLRLDDGESIEDLARLALMTPNKFTRHYMPQASIPTRSIRLEAQ